MAQTARYGAYRREIWDTRSVPAPADSPVAAAAEEGRPKVVYVMGAGHSGSTILGVTLGNCERCFYAGEVEEWLVKSGQPPWAASQRSQFWSTVTAQVDGSDLFGAEANRLIERSSAVLRIDRWARRRRMLRRYREVAQALLRAIAATAEATHVIDTSHFPLRARELRRLEGIDLYLLFLVKDPQSVVASNTRELSPHEVAERRYRALTMNANLWLTQLISVLVFLRHPRGRRLFVRYEQFIADPEGVLRQILDVVDSEAAIPDLSALQVGVPLEGNRLIRSEVIALRRSTGEAPRSSRITRLLHLPWGPVLARLRPAAVAAGETPRPEARQPR
jgi:hypothetical protein